MRNQLDLAKFLCARHEEIIWGIRKAKPDHLISIDEIEPDYDHDDEMTDVLIDLTCEGTEYRLRMGMRRFTLRVSLTRFLYDGETIVDTEEILLLEPEGDEFNTLREWEQDTIQAIADAMT